MPALPILLSLLRRVRKARSLQESRRLLITTTAALMLCACATASPTSPLLVPSPPRISAIPAKTLAANARYVRGNPDAPVTIVEFADYECPYCADNQPALRDVLAKYNGTVRLIYRDYPTHSGSLPFAEAARCAGEQDAFWKMNTYIFDHQSTLDPNHIGDYAAALGLDSAAITSCVASRHYEAAINSDGDLAVKAGADGTPTFFVNGRLLDGMQSYDQLVAAIDSALASSTADR
jgi:protein-disulfide isomerase